MSSAWGDHEMAILAADAFAWGRGWGTVDRRVVSVVGEFNYRQLPYPKLDDVPLVAAWDVRVSVDGVTWRVIVGCNLRGFYGTLCWEQVPAAEALP